MTATEAAPPHRATGKPVAARVATSAIFLANGFGIGTWATQIPRFKAELALSDGELGLALLAFALGAMLAMPAAGWVVSRVGSGLATIVSGVAFAAALVLPGAAGSLPALAAAALLAGAANGVMDVAMNTHATAVERAWGAAVMSSFHAFFSLGGLVGAAASSALIAVGLAILPTLAVAGAAIGLAIVICAPWLGLAAARPGSGHGFVLPSRAVLGIGALTFLCMVTEGAMADWTAIYLRDVAGAALSTAAAGYAAFSLAMMACRFGGDGLVRRIGRTRTLQAGGALAAAGLALALAVPWPPLAACGFALVGLGLANVVPVLFTAAGRAGGVSPSTGVAMAATLGYAGFLLGPPVIGFGADAVGLRAALAVLVASTLGIAVFARATVPRRSEP